MKDPKRLRETHASELEGLLLESVRADAPSPSARARTLAAIAIGAAAGSAAVGTSTPASAALPGSKLSWLITGKWLAIGAGAGAVVAGSLVGPLHGAMDGASPGIARPRAGVDVGSLAPGAQPPPVVAEALTEPQRVEPAAPSPGARFAPTRVAAPERAAPMLPDVPGSVPDGTPSRANPTSVTNTLPEEVAFLDAASRALREHDPARAHATLDAYAARFAGGNLGPEATALRVQAFLEQGDRAHAERIAETFLAHNPNSPHAARLRALLAGRAR
jgi:hypothetical protein